MFLALTSVGDIGLLLLREAGLLLVAEILGGFLRPNTATCLWLSGSSQAACRTPRWALFCCSSCHTTPGGDTGQGKRAHITEKVKDNSRTGVND